jgi:teichuronic acid biosynthesis glycosyltransferase TuaC
MKILVFTTLYPNNVWPDHGVFVRERIVHLAQVPGSDLKVVAPVPYFPNFKINSRWHYSQVLRTEKSDGLDIRHPRYFLVPKIGMPAYGYLMAVSLLPVLRNIEKEYSFDVIDSHFVFPDGFCAMLLGRVLKKPVVITARGSDINLYGQFRTIRPLLSYCLRRADWVITVSQALKQTVAKLNVPSEKIAVIPNGVDGTKFHPIDRAEARKSLGLPIDAKIILSVGRLVELKGFDILISALQILKNDYGMKDLYLAIAGTGALRGRLERLAASIGMASSVRFAGDVPHDSLYQWYSAADIFCLASEREGLPNVILESMACGTPVVATNVGGIPEIVASDQVGLLCQRNDKSVAASIRKAFSRSWDRKEISRVANENTWDKAAQSTYEVLQNVVAVRRKNAIA